MTHPDDFRRFTSSEIEHGTEADILDLLSLPLMIGALAIRLGLFKANTYFSGLILHS